MTKSNSMLLHKCIVFLGYLCFLFPVYFQQSKVMDALSSAVRSLIFVILLIYFILNKSLNRLIICSAIYVSIPLLITIFNRGDYYKAFGNVVNVVGLIMWSEYVKKKYSTVVLNTLTRLLEILILANYLTIIFVPKGLYRYTTDVGWESNEVWLFGLRNLHPLFLMLGCFCSYLRYYYSKRRMSDLVRVLLMHIVAVLTVYELASGGGYVMLTAYFLLLIFTKTFKSVRIDFSIGIIFHVVLFFSITIFSATMLFSDFFALFGKNGTATGRLLIWATMWVHIGEHPLIGHGFMNGKDLYWLKYIAAGATTGHNSMIDMMFTGGVATLIAFVILLLEVRRRIKPLVKLNNLYNYIVISFISLYIVLQSEGGMGSRELFTMLGIIAILPNIHSLSVRNNSYGKK